MTHDAAECDASEWTDTCNALQSYYERRGTTNVPRGARAFGVDVGAWATKVRDAYWQGELPLERQRQVESIGDWQWGPTRPLSWRHCYGLLEAYAERHATTFVVDATEGGVDLPAWAGAQRKSFRDFQLCKTQIALLNSLPDWTWDPDESRWRQGLFAVRLYIQENGSLKNVERETRLGTYPLGQWLHRCREDYRADNLQPSRISELESQPGWSWGRHVDNWRDGYACLQRFVVVHGHAAPGQKTAFEGFSLGWWVTQKRRQNRLGTLPAAQVLALEELPGWQWDPQEAQWRRGFDALMSYTDSNGAANPPRSARVNEYPVGEWVRAQRDAYARGRLPQARMSRLALLPGWRWE